MSNMSSTLITDMIWLIYFIDVKTTPWIFSVLCWENVQLKCSICSLGITFMINQYMLMYWTNSRFSINLTNISQITEECALYLLVFLDLALLKHGEDIRAAALCLLPPLGLLGCLERNTYVWSEKIHMNVLLLRFSYDFCHHTHFLLISQWKFIVHVAISNLYFQWQRGSIFQKVSRKDVL